MNLPHAIKGALWGVLAVVVAGLAVGAFTALSGSAGASTASAPAVAGERSAAPKAAKHKAKPKVPRGSITFAQYRRVPTGASKAQVRRRLGAPKARDYSEAKVLDDTTRMEFWTYDNRGERFGAFVLTFTDGKLDVKSTV